MNKLKAILIDDEPEALDTLEFLLSEHAAIRVAGKITKPVDVFPAFINEQPDLLFLDINMPGINGIELLSKIRSFDQKITVIFVTAYEHYSSMAVKQHAFDYLLKPIDRQELSNTITNVRTFLKKSEPYNRNILIKTQTKSVVIDPDEIVTLKADGNYTQIALLSGEEITTSYNMGSIAKKLPPNTLIRVNRSLMVNCAIIKSVDRKNRLCTYLNGKQKIETTASINFIKTFCSMFENE